MSLVTCSLLSLAAAEASGLAVDDAEMCFAQASDNAFISQCTIQ